MCRRRKTRRARFFCITACWMRIRFFEDHDELYWNVTGNEWENPIDLVTARIELPDGVTGLHAIAYTGMIRFARTGRAGRH